MTDSKPVKSLHEDYMGVNESEGREKDRQRSMGRAGAAVDLLKKVTPVEA